MSWHPELPPYDPAKDKLPFATRQNPRTYQARGGAVPLHKFNDPMWPPGDCCAPACTCDDEEFTYPPDVAYCCPTRFQYGDPSSMDLELHLCANGNGETVNIVMGPEGVMAPRFYVGSGTTVSGYDVFVTFYPKTCSLCVTLTPTGGGAAYQCCLPMSGTCSPINLTGSNSCPALGCPLDSTWTAVLME